MRFLLLNVKGQNSSLFKRPFWSWFNVFLLLEKIIIAYKHKLLFEKFLVCLIISKPLEIEDLDLVVFLIEIGLVCCLPYTTHLGNLKKLNFVYLMMGTPLLVLNDLWKFFFLIFVITRP